MTTSRGSGAPPDERSLVSARLLLDLVNNTLDPGYAAAALRHGPHPRRRWYDRPVTAVGALLIGFLLVVAYVHTNRGAPEAERAHRRLVERARSAQGTADALSRQLSRAENRLASAQAEVLPAAGPVVQSLQKAKLAAGQTAVRGPGLTVTLREPSTPAPARTTGRAGSIAIGDTHILSDRDVRSVVNELWLDGAEAIAVNGIRLTPLSAIRFAGQAVLVDYRPIASPYRIEAIGNADSLSTAFAQSGVASRYQTLAGTDHIGFTFDTRSTVDLPAGGPVVPRYATPEPTPTRAGAK